MFTICPWWIFRKGISKTAITRNLIAVKRKGGNSPTPTFAEIKARPNAKLIINTRKISLVFKSFWLLRLVKLMIKND
jgi:hypothetical protein